MAELVEAAETVEEVVAQLPNLPLPKWVQGAIVGVSVGIGFAGGYFFAKRQLETKFQKITDTEIAEVKAFYKTMLSTMMKLKKPDLEEVITKRGYQPEQELKANTKERVEFSEQRNIFVTPPVDEDIGEPVWDYAHEVRNRSTDVPYVIHEDEFNQGEKEYGQENITYYEEDDVLADNRGGPMDQDETIGLGNLERFGHGSSDPNIVYVRNDELRLDFEIVRSPGSYEREVHGIEHSDAPHYSRDWDD